MKRNARDWEDEALSLDPECALDLLTGGEPDLDSDEEESDAGGRGEGVGASDLSPAGCSPQLERSQRGSGLSSLGGCERLQPIPHFALVPRSYQDEAVDAWLASGGRGVIVLPTGAGKTIAALLAVARTGLRPLIVVPTIELLQQWSRALQDVLHLPESAVGQVGGGKRQFREATVITYDSAWRRPQDLAPFGLLIFDEVHHLPAVSYRSIATTSKAPLRLGLTATPEREDQRHHLLDRLVGPVVFRRSPAELSRRRHIARYRQERLYVNLTPDEEFRYYQLMTRFQWYMAKHRLWGQGFQALVFRAAADPGAREALRCQQQARQVALNAAGKADQVLLLLRRHAADRVLLFCEFTSVVDHLSRQFLLPSVTYRTPAAERKLTLERFRQGVYTKLITGRVLNEGVDVPDANVAIVVSGSATPREQIQRLGRVLRPKEEEAVLYEIVTRSTSEERTSRTRRVRE